MNFLKKMFLLMMGAKVGKRVVFYPGVILSPGTNLVLGDDVDLAWRVLMTTRGGVTIGNRTLVGYGTQILSANHNIPDGRLRIFEAGHTFGEVVIGDDVWIGANCIILPGISVGEGAVVAAGAIVTKDVQPFTIVGGVPAKVIQVRE